MIITRVVIMFIVTVVTMFMNTSVTRAMFIIFIKIGVGPSIIRT